VNRLVVLVGVAALLGGCDILDPQPLQPGRRGEQTNTLIVGKPGDVIGLDPARITDDESVEACEQIYEHLVRYKPGTTEVEAALALSWDVSDEGTVWTFKLRPGVKFHDGTPMNADAVVFSLERQRDPLHPYHSDDFSYWRDQYAYIERIDAVDPLTVRIKIERPFAPFLSSLAMFPASIVSPTAVRKHGADYPRFPVGTGPFRFHSWTPGDRLVIERNDDYWGEKARLERIVFRNIPDARQRLVALEGGAVDVAFSILPEELQYVRLHPDLRLHTVKGQNIAYVAMNTQKPPFDDPRVRQAINHAVNKKPIVLLVYQGLADIARGPIPPSMWSYRDDLVDYKYDPVLARSMLAAVEAEGKLDRRRRYTFYVPRTPRSYLPDPEQVGRVIQRNLLDIGIDTQLIVQDFGPHLSDTMQGKHDLCLLGWTADNGDPDNFLHVLLDRDPTLPGPEQNVAFYYDGRVHGLLRYAQETVALEERTTFYSQAQGIIFDDAPWVPLAHSEVAVAARNDVDGLLLQPSATMYYQHVWLHR
jgi:peptide/nickel transport system substrate-binding protein